MEACLERMCPQKNAGIGHTVSKLMKIVGDELVPAGPCV